MSQTNVEEANCKVGKQPNFDEIIAEMIGGSDWAKLAAVIDSATGHRRDLKPACPRADHRFSGENEKLESPISMDSPLGGAIILAIDCLGWAYIAPAQGGNESSAIFCKGDRCLPATWKSVYILFMEAHLNGSM